MSVTPSTPGGLRKERASWQPPGVAEAVLSCHGNRARSAEQQPPARAGVVHACVPARGHSCLLRGITQVTAVYSHRLLRAPLLLLKWASLPAEFPLRARDLGLHLPLAQPSLNAAMMSVPQEERRVVSCPKTHAQRRRRGSGTSRHFRNGLLSKLWLVQSPLCAVSVGSVRRRASIAH